MRALTPQISEFHAAAMSPLRNFVADVRQRLDAGEHEAVVAAETGFNLDVGTWRDFPRIVLAGMLSTAIVELAHSERMRDET